MPHTDEDEGMTPRRVPASRAASTTLRVPVTLPRWMSADPG